MAFQREFYNEFELWDKKNCTINAGDPAPQIKDICPFEVDWWPAGPFLTAQYSFFIAKAHYETAVRWTM